MANNALSDRQIQVNKKKKKKKSGVIKVTSIRFVKPLSPLHANIATRINPLGHIACDKHIGMLRKKLITATINIYV